jgi:hypothetical protein
MNGACTETEKISVQAPENGIHRMESTAYNEPIFFYPLLFVPENDLEVTVGRLDIDSYALFPTDGAALLQQMQAGLSPQKAAAWYEQHYGEPIDIEDFLSNLRALSFLRENGETDEVQPATRSLSWRWLAYLTFSPFAWCLYVLLFIYCLYTIIRFPALFPSYQNIFFSPYFTVVEIGLFFGQIPGILFHELYHILAGRRLGIPARLGLGHRLHILVFETTLTGLWSVPARSRYLPFLAGMLADTVMFSLLTIVAGMTIQHGAVSSFVGLFCLALAFSTIMRILWQFYFYLRTDLYYVFTHAFGCIDLQRTTQKYLLNRLFRTLHLFDRVEEETEWYPKDRQIARWYAPLYVLGNLFSLGIFLGVGLPTLIRIATGIFAHLHAGSGNTDTFWDSCLFLTLNLLQLSLVVIISIRERLQTRKQRH